MGDILLFFGLRAVRCLQQPFLRTAWGESLEALCEQLSRTNFVFVEIKRHDTAKSHIVDACCGPHIETETLNQFIANSIDVTYKRGNVPVGTIHNVLDWPRYITQLY